MTPPEGKGYVLKEKGMVQVFLTSNRTDAIKSETQMALGSLARPYSLQHKKLPQISHHSAWRTTHEHEAETGTWQKQRHPWSANPARRQLPQPKYFTALFSEFEHVAQV